MNMNSTQENKTCTKCNSAKPIKQFREDPFYKGGFTTWCKDCLYKASSAWKQEHKGKYREYQQQWAKNNPEKRREFKRAWDKKRREDPTFRLSNNIRTSMCHALQGKKGFKKWETLVKYTLEDLIKHLSPMLKDGMTWDNYGELWQVDHITPKSWYKYDSAEHPSFGECWSLSNLQPKLKTENIKKGNRYRG